MRGHSQSIKIGALKVAYFGTLLSPQTSNLWAVCHGDDVLSWHNTRDAADLALLRYALACGAEIVKGGAGVNVMGGR